MKKYIKDGKIKNRNQIVIKGKRTIKDKDGKDKIVGTQIINPKHEDLIAEGWEEYIAPTPAEPTEEQKLNRNKNSKKHEVQMYHDSNDVKGFSINGEAHSVDTETLNKMTFRVMAELAMHINKTTLWFNGKTYNFKTKDAMDLLYQLQIYFGNCFDVTNEHKNNIDNLSSQEEVDGYDYRSGYPQKVDINN